jgi:hypothetical protein
MQMLPDQVMPRLTGRIEVAEVPNDSTIWAKLNGLKLGTIGSKQASAKVDHPIREDRVT